MNIEDTIPPMRDRSAIGRIDSPHLTTALNEVERNRDRLVETVEQLDQYLLGAVQATVDVLGHTLRAPLRLIQKHPLWAAAGIATFGTVVGLMHQERIGSGSPKGALPGDLREEAIPDLGFRSDSTPLGLPLSPLEVTQNVASGSES